mmetsp:Transcript_67164/g.160207  ORF Transcript_67164/g.160207 Transcript_67164/m.160207 type:complete len:170 (+) Transcript_67164:108-617(+)|eukprot:CAMPEP_0180133872 /NCGR_PEP_ID=MMETSP0986-20121125/9797_1 /TAXON_ID=697907 /ORGANISM="non described non described, Strain CCMP2293" /LENGTH=169 /DNA_ID=CAMNT_0022074069 /DNA_START=95 /DNA_END=607 /DNA_ORIENTATION=+
MAMLAGLVAGYSTSEGEDSDGEEAKAAVGKKQEAAHPAPAEKQAAAEPAAKPKRKLPSASAMMDATSSWAKHDTAEAPREADIKGTQYHNVAPPVGYRAEDGIGKEADFIKPVVDASIDSTKLHKGVGMYSKKSLVPPQVQGRKNVSTEDTKSWTSEKRGKKDCLGSGK